MKKIIISFIVVILLLLLLGINTDETVDEFQQRTQEKITNLTRSEKLQTIYKDALKLSKPKVSGGHLNLGLFIDRVADELDANNYPIDELVSIMTSNENINALVEEGRDRKVAIGILTYMAIISPIVQGLEGMSIFYIPYQQNSISVFSNLWDRINRYGTKEKEEKTIYNRLQKSRYGKNFDLGL